MKLFRITVAVLVALSLSESTVKACNVPVFRFALERWRPDAYQAIVYHRGPLSAEAKKAVALLEKNGPEKAKSANLSLKVVDLAEKIDAKYRELYDAEGGPLPWVAVVGSGLEARKVLSWSGPLSTENVARLIDSPARREVGKRLLAGETAVYVFLECGDGKKDSEALERLGKELEALRPKLKLPELSEKPEDRLAAGGPPLGVKFSILRVARADPAEKGFVSLLLASEEDLSDRKEPMAFALFGRGRALPCLVGAGINPNTVADDCTVLLAPCTCELKGKHPGFDVLMAVDWDAAFDGTLPKAADKPAIRDGERVPLGGPGAGDGSGSEAKGRSADLWIGAGAVGVLALVAGAWVLVSGRSAG